MGYSEPGKPYANRAILHCVEGKVMFNIERRTLLGASYAPRPAHIPKATEAQVEALDLLQSLAEKHQLTTSIRRGDMRFINNYGILHSRESFKDGGESKRHLIRLWLQRGNGEVGWKLSEELVDVMASRAVDDSRGNLKWNPGMVITAKDVLDQARETCDGGSVRPY